MFDDQVDLGVPQRREFEAGEAEAGALWRLKKNNNNNQKKKKKSQGDLHRNVQDSTIYFYFYFLKGQPCT